MSISQKKMDGPLSSSSRGAILNRMQVWSSHWAFLFFGLDGVDPGGRWLTQTSLPAPQQFRIGPDFEMGPGLISVATTWPQCGHTGEGKHVSHDGLLAHTRTCGHPGHTYPVDPALTYLTHNPNTWTFWF